MYEQYKNILLVCFSVSIMFLYNAVWADDIPGQKIKNFNMPTGAVDEEVEENVYINQNSLNLENEELPQAVNLSADKYFPKIRMQYGGSCVAWATTYYQFTYEAARLNDWNAKDDS